MLRWFSFEWGPETTVLPDGRVVLGSKSQLRRDTRESRGRVRTRARKEQLLRERKEQLLNKDDAIDPKISEMQLCARQRSMHQLLDKFQEYLLDSADDPEIEAVNLNILALGAVVDIDAAEDAFNSMKKRYGLRPNPGSYRSLISSYGVANDRAKARKIFDSLKLKFGSHVLHYNALIDALGNATDVEDGNQDVSEGKELLESLKGAGHDPDIDTYINLVRLCCRAGRLQDAIDYLHECAPLHKPWLTMYEMIFECMAGKEMSDEELRTQVVSLLEHLSLQMLKVTNKTTEAVMRLFDQRGNPMEVFDVFEEVSKKVRWRRASYLAANVFCMERLVRRGDKTPRAAMQFISSILPPNVRAHDQLGVNGYSGWLRICFMAGDYDKTMECWRSAVERGRIDDTETIKCVIDINLQNDHLWHAMELFTFMKERRIKPTLDHFKSVFEYLAKIKDRGTARSLFNEMRKIKMDPDDDLEKCLASLNLL